MTDDHKHGHEDECFACKNGRGAQVEWEMQMMEKYGFYSHFVIDCPPPFANAHTHGFDITWKHKDFQVVLHIRPEVVQSIFSTFANRVKSGERFQDGQDVEKIIQNFPVRLMGTQEDGRDVLRILLPDKNGKFPGEPGVDPGFGDQAIWSP